MKLQIITHVVLEFLLMHGNLNFAFHRVNIYFIWENVCINSKSSFIITLQTISQHQTRVDGLRVNIKKRMSLTYSIIAQLIRHFEKFSCFRAYILFYWIKTFNNNFFYYGSVSSNSFISQKRALAKLQKEVSIISKFNSKTEKLLV